MTIKYPMNFIFFIIPILSAIILILGIKKKDIILNSINLSLNKSVERIKIGLMIVGLCIISVALMGPQMVDGTVEIKKNSLDIYVLLDTSKSMLVKDVVPSRIDREKQILEEILSKLNGDRIGFIPFSSSAYIQMPLTDDYAMAKMYLDVLDTDMIGGGGSNVGKAISLAKDSFKRTGSSDKVLLIISDGEEHDTKSEKALEKINDDKLKVYAIGVGTKEGGLIPVYSQDGKVTSYKKDNKGNHIMSRLHDDTLKKLARIGNGKYYTSGQDLKEIDSLMLNISKLRKDNRGSREVKRYKQLFHYFLAVGLVLFLLGYFLPVRRMER